MEEEKYQHGFNSGYTLAKYEPALFAQITKDLKPNSDYLEGLLFGGKQHEMEISKIHEAKKSQDKDNTKGKEDFEIDIEK